MTIVHHDDCVVVAVGSINLLLLILSLTYTKTQKYKSIEMGGGAEVDNPARDR